MGTRGRRVLTTDGSFHLEVSPRGQIDVREAISMSLLGIDFRLVDRGSGNF